MDFEPIYNKHYIQTNERNEVVNSFSDAFRQPTDGDICINEQGGYQFRLIVDGEQTEENPLLFDFPSMTPLYKWDGEVKHRTDEELDADREAWAARMAAEEAERQANSPEARLDALELAMCEADEANEAWRSEIENALCEMDEESEG